MSNPEFDSLYATAKYNKFGLDSDYIGDSVVESAVVIAMYEELSATQQKLEAAEARIKASQEQEPVAYVLSAEEAARTDGRTPVLYIGALPLGKNLYAAPVIPPDVAELQRQVEFWKNSSREWKLAYVALGGTASDSGKAELTKLLAEAKSKAVPDSARLDFVMTHDAFIVKRNSGNRADIFQLWTQDEDEEYHVLHDKSEFFKTEREAIDAAMLADAPQPDRG